MPIVASKTRQIHDLIVRLGAANEVQRETAIARLTLLGERATEALINALPRTSPLTQLGVLSVFEATGDRRCSPSILACFDSADSAVAQRAIRAATALPGSATARALGQAAGRHPDPLTQQAALAVLFELAQAGGLEALDALLALLFDEKACLASRLAAFPVLDLLTARQRKPLLRDLRAVPELAPRVAALEKGVAETPKRQPRVSAAVTVTSLLDELLANPNDAGLVLDLGQSLRQQGGSAEPEVRAALARTRDLLPLRALVEALGHYRRTASLPPLRQLLDRLTRRAASGEDGASVAELKARVHLVLAQMGSRLALYDLREMLEARPLLAAPSLLQAATELGDASLVPALAALAGDAPEILDACRGAFQAIVGREKLRRASKALKAVRPEHRRGLERLWAAKR